MQRVRFEHPEARMLQVGNLVVVDWIGEIRERYVTRLEAVIREVAAEHDHPVGVLVIIREATPTPDAELRRKIQSSLSQIEPSIGAMASVVEGEGVRSFAIRAIFNGMRTFTRTRHPHRAFADVPEALDWLVDRLRANPEVRWTASDVRAAIGT